MDATSRTRPPTTKYARKPRFIAKCSFVTDIPPRSVAERLAGAGSAHRSTPIIPISPPSSSAIPTIIRTPMPF
jgi:hypothetical protein